MVLGNDEWEPQELGMLDRDVESMRYYLQIVEEQIELRKPRLKIAIEANEAKRYGERDDALSDQLLRKLQGLQGTIPDILYDGSVMYVWTYFESNLLRFSREAVTRSIRNAGGDDAAIAAKLKGFKSPKKIIDLLENNGIPITTDPDWPEVEEIQKVRNLFTHTRGVIYDESDAAVEYARDREENGEKGLTAFQGMRLISDKDFCHHLIALVNRVLTKVIKQMPPYDEAMLQALWSRKPDLSECPTDDTQEPLLLPKWDDMPTPE